MSDEKDKARELFTAKDFYECGEENCRREHEDFGLSDFDMACIAQVKFARWYAEHHAPLEKENERLRGALEFYAKGYHIESCFDESDADWTRNKPDIVENGEIARFALKGEEKARKK